MYGPWKKCSDCGLERRTTDFSLINPNDFSDVRRDDICGSCIKESKLIRSLKRRGRKKRMKKSYAKTPEGMREKRARACHHTNKRKIIKLKAMPSWVDKFAIEAIYIKCAEITAKTNIHHEVDHIIPLQHKKVCGLHVPWNLQILTKSENASKSNKLVVK